MNARIEAAAKAGHSHVYGDDHFDFLPDHAKDRHRETISAALAASDAVMFSDEAIERAVWELYKRAYPEHAAERLEQVGAPIRNSYMQHVRIVVAALKGDA